MQGDAVQEIDFSKAEALMPELEAAHEAVNEVIPRLAEARRKYAETGSEYDRLEHDRVQREAEEKHATFGAMLKRVEEATGIPEEIFEKLSEPKVRSDPVNRTARAQLTAAQIDPTAYIEAVLPEAVEALLEMLPVGWLEQEHTDQFSLPVEDTGRAVSIVKGVRPESEDTPGHPLRQAIRIAQDYLSSNARYDHFAGAILVPQTAQLGARLDILKDIKGASSRIANLWRKPREVPNTTFELLVAAALAELGRKPAFIPETQRKSPDIRCHDPFPLVVKCKRRKSLSDYERAEERIMRGLFARLDAEARKLGLCGLFELRLDVEPERLVAAEVVEKCLLHRLLAHPERPLAYPWGSVSFHERPARLALPAPTKAYSPQLLEFAFAWNADLPEWDGLICKAVTPEGVMVDEVREGIALAWSNLSAAVVTKRSRSPASLFGSAIEQVPGGEFGIVYLAYNEGAREEIADLRVQQVSRRLHEWEHSAKLRIPVSFLVRLYPRALDEGRPDLIESTIQYYSEVSGGAPWFFEAFPSRIFTPGE